MIVLPLLMGLAFPTADTKPTFNKDIAPVLWKNCTNCHRTGEIGPFPLMTYKEAAKRADFLAEVVASRQMPPWKAEPGFGKFRDEHRLSDAEIKLFADWAKAGAPEGDANDLPAQPKFTEGWPLGKPDLVLEMPKPFKLYASGKDLQQCFVIPIPIDEDKSVAAVEFRPGNSKIVHHAILYLDQLGLARRKDKTGEGYNSFGGPGILPSGSLGAWAPGAAAQPLPDGIGKFVKKGSDLVLQIHYHPSGKEETDQSKIGIYFSKKPAKQFVGGLGVSTRAIRIEPGDSNYAVKAESAPLPVDAKAIAVFPHMHYVGKQMKAWVELPDGKTTPLIWIKDWDFNWQGSYTLAEAVELPKGSKIKVEAVYDNSTMNPRNPSNPPVRVTHGEQTTNEMCLLGLQIVTEKPEQMRDIYRMKGNMTGRLFGGAVPTSIGGEDLVPIADELPDALRTLFKTYDKNGDGFLSNEEIEAMPAFIRDKIRERTGKKKD